MERESTPQPEKRLTVIGKAVWLENIFSRLREGWVDDETARDVRLSAAGVRPIAPATPKTREVDRGAARRSWSSLISGQRGAAGMAVRAVGGLEKKFLIRDRTQPP